MSDADITVPSLAVQASAVVGTEPVSAGAQLRRAREAAGLHIAALAVSLKVPVRKLEALEADRLDELPDAVFVRALASSVCRALKIDPQPVLDLLPKTSRQTLGNDERGINAPFRGTDQPARSSVKDHLSKPGSLAVIALLLGTVLLAVFPLATDQDAGRVQVANREASPVLPSVTAPPAQNANPELPVQASSIAKSSESAVVAASVPTAVAAADVSAPLTTAASSATPVASAPAAIATGSGVPIGLLVLKARGSSWVDVVDGTGASQLRRTLTIGEVVLVNGKTPLSVVVGRADTTDIFVRGKAVDVSRQTRDNVARFEVN